MEDSSKNLKEDKPFAKTFNSNTFWKWVLVLFGICLLVSSILSIAILGYYISCVSPDYNSDTDGKYLWILITIGLNILLNFTIMYPYIRTIRSFWNTLHNEVEKTFVKNLDPNKKINTLIYTSEKVIPFYISYIESTTKIINNNLWIQLTLISQIILSIITYSVISSYFRGNIFKNLEICLVLIIINIIFILFSLFFIILFYNRWCVRFYDINDINGVYSEDKFFTLEKVKIN